MDGGITDLDHQLGARTAIGVLGLEIWIGLGDKGWRLSLEIWVGMWIRD